jgi:type VI secretion system secreted protein VgrG
LTQDVFGIRGAAYFLKSMFSSMSGSGTYSVNAASTIMLNAALNSVHTTGGTSIITVGMDHVQNVGGNIRLAAGQNSEEVVHGKKTVEGHEAIYLRSGKSELRLDADGTITMKGVKLIIEQEETVKATAAKIELN